MGKAVGVTCSCCSSSGKPATGSFEKAGGVRESVVSMTDDRQTTPGLPRNSPSGSADTELVLLSRAGREGSDWKARICSTASLVKLCFELYCGLAASLGLVSGDVKAPMDVVLDETTVSIVPWRDCALLNMLSPGEGGQGTDAGSAA